LITESGQAAVNASGSCRPLRRVGAPFV
jgi:hypothetical protein